VVGAKGGLYSQAIEGVRDLQVDQVYQDIKGHLSTTLQPKGWAEFFELIGLQKELRVLCLDEFPYLVASDPTLPSVLQKWLDHKMPPGFLLILAGSSTRMMHDLFLNRAAPLYGRAKKILAIAQMGYGAYCQVCHLKSTDMDAFVRFAMVGGNPRYWEFVNEKISPTEMAEELFFGFSPYLDQEPSRILRDEEIAGVNALSVLETVGRGARKPSEVAARMGIVQTNLSRVIQQLMDTSLLTREVPFGESLRSTKRTLYVIDDPALRFWFGVFSPHRTRWREYTRAQKTKLLTTLRPSSRTCAANYIQRRPVIGRVIWSSTLCARKTIRPEKKPPSSAR